MIINNVKALEESQSFQGVAVSTILDEIRQHGFYSNYCTNLNNAIVDTDELVGEIRKIASKNLLRVTFNADKTICIFED